MIELVRLIREIIGDKLIKYALIIIFVFLVFFVPWSFFYLKCSIYLFGVKFGPSTECSGSTLVSEMKGDENGKKVDFLGFANEEMQTQYSIIAYYRFNNTESNLADNSNSETNFDLQNARYGEEGTALRLNGKYSGNVEDEYIDPNVDKGYRAIAYLGDRFDYNEFTFSLQFNAKEFNQDRTTDPGNAPDTILVGGVLYRWFGIRWNSGHLELTLNNQEYQAPLKNLTLDTDVWHTVICSINLSNKRILTVLDEHPIIETDLPPNFKLDVADSQSEKKDRFLTFTNYSNGGTFDGLVRRLGAFGKSLSREEIESIRRFYRLEDLR